MGKHKKDKKSKKHKKEKKHKKKERKHSPSSSSSEDEWVEKAPSPVEPTGNTAITSCMVEPSTSGSMFANINVQEDLQRDDWMSLPTSFTSISNNDRRLERENKKKLDKERDTYNPSENVRELNPYWKGGGDGLPKFKKPSYDDDYNSYDTSKSSTSTSRRTGTSSWRKKPVNEFTEERISNNKSDYIYSSETKEAVVLSDGDLNALAAKLVKAEILGDSALIKELQEQLENAKMARSSGSVNPHSNEQEVILTQTDSKGYTRPLKNQAEYGEYSGGSKKKKQKVETHNDGQRIRYFPDDDKYSLKQMFENEKYSSMEDSNRQFMQLAGKIRKNDDLDDVFADSVRRKESDEKVDRRNREKAINEHKQMTEALDNCNNCLQSEKMMKHLMVSMTESIYLSLPHYEPLTTGHCLLIPVRHTSCSTQLDENEWAEMLNYRRVLTKMFNEKNEDVIFFEIAMFLHRHPHMSLHCVPVPKEQGDLAPIYFKKAIDESEMEWVSNKKLVSLAGRDVRRAIPKGLPYFAVSFGMSEGFAHVIEDQRLFPTNFAQEIIGGMLDLHHSKWRKPKSQKFDEQKQRVLEFSKEWNPYDFNTN